MRSKEYIKVYGSFFTGSFRAQKPTVKVVFLALLALARGDGQVEATDETIGFHAGVSKLDQVKLAIDLLCQPDPNSTSPAEEGRRVVRLGPNRLRVVNYELYLGRGREENPRRDYQREYQRQRRAKMRESVDDQVQNVDSKQVSTVNTQKKGNEIDKPPKPPKGGSRKRKALQGGEPANDAAWAEFEGAYPRPTNGRALNKKEGREIFDALIESGTPSAEIVAGAKRYNSWVVMHEKGEYVKGIPAWLNGQFWKEAYEVRDDAKKLRELDRIEPEIGVDYWIDNIPAERPGMAGTIVKKCMEDGEKIDRPFSVEAWKRQKREEFLSR